MTYYIDKSEELLIFNRFSSSFFELLDELSQWSQLFLFHEVEPSDEEDEVFEASIEMVFCSQTHDVLEVGMVDVSIDSE